MKDSKKIIIILCSITIILVVIIILLVLKINNVNNQKNNNTNEKIINESIINENLTDEITSNETYDTNTNSLINSSKTKQNKTNDDNTTLKANSDRCLNGEYINGKCKVVSEQPADVEYKCNDKGRQEILIEETGECIINYEDNLYNVKECYNEDKSNSENDLIEFNYETGVCYKCEQISLPLECDEDEIVISESHVINGKTYKKCGRNCNVYNVCNTGFKYHEELDRCVPTSSSFCPTGYTLDGTSCKRDATVVSIKCSDNIKNLLNGTSKLNGKVCTYTYYEDPLY